MARRRLRGGRRGAAYARCWPELLRVLRPGGTVAVDNAISHAHELGELTTLLEADERVTTTVVPVGAGLRIAVVGRPGDHPAIAT